MNITSVTSSWRKGDSANINGSGFGATQGDSVLLFYPVFGAPLAVTPSSWSNTVIHASIPEDATVGATGYFIVQLADGSPGERSDGSEVLAALVTAELSYDSQAFVTAKPGSSGETLEI